MRTAKSDEELDRIFEEGKESILDYADMGTMRKPNREKREDGTLRQLSITLPEWLVGTLDREASRIGISRQAVLKTWLVERADMLQTA